MFSLCGRSRLLNHSPSNQPYQGKCKDCKQPVTQNKAKYCHGVSAFFCVVKDTPDRVLQVVLIKRASAQYAAGLSWTRRDTSCLASSFSALTFHTLVVAYIHSFVVIYAEEHALEADTLRSQCGSMQVVSHPHLIEV